MRGAGITIAYSRPEVLLKGLLISRSGHRVGGGLENSRHEPSRSNPRKHRQLNDLWFSCRIMKVVGIRNSLN